MPEPDSSSPALAGDTDIVVLDPAWRRAVRNPERRVLRALDAAGVAATAVLADDRTVKSLNFLHRGRGKPTNVLTYDRPAPEIVLALGVVRREARANGRGVGDHLSHLAVHGALHLLGMDHDHPGDARRMEMAEARILRRLGVPNPWKRA
jgi:probable rRNA maturation factor